MLIANENTQKKQSLGTPQLWSLYTSIQHIPPTPKTVLWAPQAAVPANSILRANLMLHPAIWNARFFAVSLCGNQSPFGTYNAAYSRKMLQVGVRTLTSSCFGFACARAQGTRHRRRRQVPCPLTKMIGRNRLQEFKHSFNQKNWPGVTNNQSSVSSAD
jgi:hypothetical protein